MRGVDDFWIDVSDDEVDLVGQPADAEHHHHNHHHLDDLLGKVKVKVKHDFTAPLLSRIERRAELSTITIPIVILCPIVGEKMTG